MHIDMLTSVAVGAGKRSFGTFHHLWKLLRGSELLRYYLPIRPRSDWMTRDNTPMVIAPNDANSQKEYLWLHQQRAHLFGLFHSVSLVIEVFVGV